MSKALLTRFLARSVRHGRLGVVFADGSDHTFGTPVPGFPEIVLRFTDEASLTRWEGSLPRRMWLERGASLVRATHETRVSGMDSWFGPRVSAPPRWKQAVSIWVAYFPMLLLFSTLFNPILSALPLFWRVLVTTACMTPVLSFVCMPVITRLLRGWLYAGNSPRALKALRS